MQRRGDRRGNRKGRSGKRLQCRGNRKKHGKGSKYCGKLSGYGPGCSVGRNRPGQYYGGGFRGAPLAKPDDGLFDVCLVPKLGRRKILSIIGRYQKGLHTQDEELRRLVTYRQVRRLEARFDSPITICADGETFQGTSLTAQILPGAIRLWRPRESH